jgi:hypothetical protein
VSRRARPRRGSIAVVLAAVAALSGCMSVKYELTDTVRLIPSDPPMTTSGVVGRYDPDTRVLTFEDGRTVRITEATKVARAVGGDMRPGEQVIVEVAMPVGVAWPGDVPMSTFK